MKLLLIQPPIRDFYETDVRLQPIGLAYLKAAVRKALPDVEVGIFDFHHGWGRKTIKLPKELSYLWPYYEIADQGPFSTFHHYYHFGADYSQIESIIRKENPDVVGISMLFTAYSNEALEAAAAVKRVSHAVVIAGGSHVSVAPYEVLANSAIDFTIQGEGESALVRFLIELKNKSPDWGRVPSLGYKEGRNIILNQIGGSDSIEDLPMPDLSDFRPESYRYEKLPLTFMTTSRSCPYRCTFCTVHHTFGAKYRRRSVDSILRELEVRYEEGYRIFDFEDDNLTFVKDEALLLFKSIVDAYPKGDHRLVAMNGLSYMNLDSELLEWMWLAGFRHLNLSLVSLSEASNRVLHRPYSRQRFLDVVQAGFQQGFKITAYWIAGLPFETPKDMVETLSCLAGLPVLIGASIFYATPGATVVSASEFLKARNTAMAIVSDRFDRDDLYTFFVATRIVNFLKSIDVGYGPRISLNELFRRKPNTPRTALGMEILQELFSSRVLFAPTSTGRRPLKRFKSDVFFSFWAKTPQIRTLKGACITE